MTDLEDRFVAECRRQGYQPGPDVMRQIAVDLAGSVLTDSGLVLLPGRGSISMTDLARSLRGQMPEDFGNLDDKLPAITSTGTLTERYRAEIAASRKQARITDADVARYTGITRQYMEERRRAAREK